MTQSSMLHLTHDMLMYETRARCVPIICQEEKLIRKKLAKGILRKKKSCAFHVLSDDAHKRVPHNRKKERLNSETTRGRTKKMKNSYPPVCSGSVANL